MAARHASFRKSDFRPAFEAAFDAGFDEVRIEVETPDGTQFKITAGHADKEINSGQTPLGIWKAENGTS